MNNNWEFDQDNKNINTDSSMNMEDQIFGAISSQQSPRKIKLEITTRVESIATAAMVLSLIITAGLFFISYEDKLQIINAKTITALAVSIMLIIVRMNVDEYYVLDTGRQALMLRSKIFSKESYTVYAYFKTIDAVVANGKYNSGGKNSPSYWTYRAEIVLRTGKVLPIDDWTREGLSEACCKASNFAKHANVNYVPGLNHGCATPIRRGNKYTFKVKERTFLDGLKEAWPILIVLALMAAIPAIVAIFEK